jgi:hypothetical protein
MSSLPFDAEASLDKEKNSRLRATRLYFGAKGESNFRRPGLLTRSHRSNKLIHPESDSKQSELLCHRIEKARGRKLFNRPQELRPPLDNSGAGRPSTPGAKKPDSVC